MLRVEILHFADKWRWSVSKPRRIFFGMFTRWIPVYTGLESTVALAHEAALRYSLIYQDFNLGRLGKDKRR